MSEITKDPPERKRRWKNIISGEPNIANREISQTELMLNNCSKFLFKSYGVSIKRAKPSYIWLNSSITT